MTKDEFYRMVCTTGPRGKPGTVSRDVAGAQPRDHAADINKRIRRRAGNVLYIDFKLKSRG
jgi:hypothetical protein